MAVAVAMVMVAPPALAEVEVATERMSEAADGSGANGKSREQSMSADGRFVVFQSEASNLVAGDTNGVRDIFLRDRQEGTIERVSVADDGSQVEVAGCKRCRPQGAWDPDISGDGRYVVFTSRSNDLVQQDKNAATNVFIRDREAGTTEMVSVADDGTPGDARSRHPVVSDDGRFVAFGSWADNFVSGTKEWEWQVFVRDRQEGTTELVSVHDDGSQADNKSTRPKISADGQVVVFTSKDGNLHDPDSDRGKQSVYVRDRGAEATELAAVASDGTPADKASRHPGLSPDGSVVAFTSRAGNLVAGDGNGVADVFVHDRDTGATQRVSVASDGTESNARSGGHATQLGTRVLSEHGDVIAFWSAADNLVAGDTNGVIDVFVHDRRSGGTERMSVAADGSEANGVAGYVNDHGKYLFGPSISRDGQVVAFRSEATNLVPGDTNGLGDTYVRANQGPRLSLGMVPADSEGGESTVTATVVDDDGAPMAGETVEFAVSGAQTASGSATTGAEGSATFTYAGQQAGKDTITAFADLDGSGGEDDGEPAGTISTLWMPAAVELQPPESTSLVGEEHMVTAVVTDDGGEAAPEMPVEFRVSGANSEVHSASGSATADAQGEASFTYTGPTAGEDTITAFADGQRNGTQDDVEPAATASATWQNSEERQTGTWSEGGSFRQGRALSTASRLSDREVLLVGGYWAGANSAEIWNPGTRQSRLVDAPEKRRRQHTATRLADGSVLVTGGNASSSIPSGGPAHAGVEVFDPDEEAWSTVKPMAQERMEHTATRLDDGRVLVTGGRAAARWRDDTQKLASAEIYDPQTDTWQSAGSMEHARVRHTATRLDDGRVLVTGGGSTGGRLDSAEVFDPEGGEDGGGAWSTVEAMNRSRNPHAAVKLATGEVLVTGGGDADGEAQASAEVFDPSSNTWETAAPMNTARKSHTLSLLDDGTVLAVGGSDDLGAERYDPDADAWWGAGGRKWSHGNHSAMVLANGQVLVAKGAAHVYSPRNLPAPTVTSVSPRVGSVDGGFEVTVTGEHLGEALFGYFGEESAVEVVQDSSEQVRLVAPEHPPAEVPVTVSTPGGVSEVSEAATVTFEARDGQWQRTAGDTTTQHPAGVGMVALGGAACEGASPPGYCDQVLQVSGETSELYDPQADAFGGSAKLPFSDPGGDNAWNVASRMTTLDGPACRGNEAPDYCGEVLAVDDGGSEGVARYDPASNSWQQLATMPNEQKVNHVVVLDGPACRDVGGQAPDHCGKVLASTHDPGVSSNFNMPRMWLYDPGANEWTERAQPTEKRKSYAMTLVDGPACAGDEPPAACGQVLVTGSAKWSNTAQLFESQTAELYDPAADTWRETADRPQTGTPWQHTTTLEDGRLLVAGAGGYAEIFNPANEAWEAVPPPLEGHGGSDSVRLPDGRVMVTGGRRPHADKTQVMVFDPFAGANGEWSYTASLEAGRHNVTGLSDGRVLAGGGEFGEVYTPAPGALSGTVTGGQGEALAGAEVTVTDSGGEQVASTTSGDGGAYRVGDLAYGAYTITADADGHESASKDVRVVAGPNAADFALTAATAGGGGVVDAGAGTGQVDGTVSDSESGAEVAGAEVAVADEAGSVVVTAGTDATGTYSVTGLSAGSYLLTATADGYQSGSQEVAVEAGETVTADFALQPAETVGHVEGAVIDAATGEALPGVTVTVDDDTGAQVVAARTDAEGVYSVENLPPSGYTLTAEVDGYESASQDVTVEAGQTATADFALQPAGTGDGTGAAGLGGLTSEELVAAACNPSVVPEAGFGDVAGSVHADSVACVAWYGLALGLGDVDGDGQDEYGPGLPVSRAQMASFISRLAGEAGVALPEAPADAFGDDDGSVHEDAINQLAEVGLVKGVGDGSYAPQSPVSRAQMASFLARLADQAGLALPENPADAFGDDDGSVHEDNINALAAANVTQGVAEGAYGPNGPVSRGQMASFLGRMLGGFVDAGVAPAGGAEVALADTETAPGGQLAGQATSNKQVVGLVANGCGLDEQPVEVSDGDFTVAVPEGQAGGECELVLAVTTSRDAGSDTPTQTVQYVFPVAIASSGGQ